MCPPSASHSPAKYRGLCRNHQALDAALRAWAVPQPNSSTELLASVHFPWSRSIFLVCTWQVWIREFYYPGSGLSCPCELGCPIWLLGLPAELRWLWEQAWPGLLPQLKVSNCCGLRLDRVQWLRGTECSLTGQHYCADFSPNVSNSGPELAILSSRKIWKYVALHSSGWPCQQAAQEINMMCDCCWCHPITDTWKKFCSWDFEQSLQ